MEKKENLHANHRQRLKKRALLEGLDNFEPHNALELMLFYALPHVDTNDIAHELINRFGSFDGVFDAPIEELVKVKGIKEQAATFIKLMPEFCRYYYTHRKSDFAKKLDYDGIGQIFAKLFIGRKEEVVACVFIDNEGYYINSKVMFTGSINSVSFSLRDVVDEALRCGAFKVAFGHNHPTQCLFPSMQDIETTRRVKDSLAEMKIEFIDNYIVTSEHYFGVLAFVESKMKSEALEKIRRK